MVFKALSDRNRLRIIAALMKREELCACQLTELIRVTGATASRHMGILISSGLVAGRKDGRWVYYRLSRDNCDLRVLLDWVGRQIDNDPEMAADAEKLDEITSCDPEELCRKQRGDKCCREKTGLYKPRRNS